MLARNFCLFASDASVRVGLRVAIASILSASALSAVAQESTQTSAAQQSAIAADASTGDSSDPLASVVVTGSRLVRDGYEAPTPLTVVGVEQFQQQASPNVIDYLTTL